MTMAFAAVSLVVGSPASAYPRFCPPSQDPDCYFLFVMVNQMKFDVSGGTGAALIQKGKEACADMDAAGGSLPPLGYAVRFGREHPSTVGSDGYSHQALEFAMLSAAAYCPWNSN